MKKSKAPVIDPNYKNISKKYACFVIHHYFMASRVEMSIGICEMIGTMEIQHWAGQYARKVLTKMPLEMPDAIFHRIYPCIRWLQGGERKGVRIHVILIFCSVHFFSVTRTPTHITNTM